MNQSPRKGPVLPRVSVVSISYNQEKYVADALDGFLLQKTEFPFEVIIADDDSSDRTQEIIRDYAKRYPGIIKPILRKKNVGIQKNIQDAMSRANGEFIALCEGDDFWTDPLKLQRQVDFLSSHPDHNLVFHPVRVFFENKEHEDGIHPDVSGKRDFTLEGLLRRNFIQTNSVMYRKKDYVDMPTDILPLDWYLHLYHAKGGKIGFINRVMSAYRRHEGGVWWNSDRDFTELWVRHGLSHFRLYEEIIKLYGSNKKHEAIIHQHINSLFKNILKLKKENSTPILKQIMAKNPDALVLFIQQQYDMSVHYASEMANLVSRLEKEANEARMVTEQVHQELAAIYESKLWKLRKPLSVLKRAIRKTSK